MPVTSLWPEAEVDSSLRERERKKKKKYALEGPRGIHRINVIAKEQSSEGTVARAALETQGS